MKIKIRKGTFETNSSSMHSLVILKEDKKPAVIENDIYVRDDGTYAIWSEEDLEFGRYPFEILSSSADKFRYLIAECNNSDERKEVIKAFKNVCPEVKKIEFPKDYSTSRNYYGYVDHESQGLVSDYLKENNISFEEFLKDTKYKIIIDGDEYCEWEKMKESGLIDLSAIEIDINPYSKYYNKDLDDDEIDYDEER